MNTVSTMETENKKWTQELRTNKFILIFKLDIGAESNVLSFKYFKKISNKTPTTLKKSNARQLHILATRWRQGKVMV